MDPTEEIELLIREMEGDIMPDTFQAVLEEILGEAPNAPPPPPQAEQWFNIHPQPVGSVTGGYGGCLQLDTDPYSFQAESAGRTALTDDFDRLVNLMEWDEVLGTVQAVMGEALGDTPNPPPAPQGAAAFSAPPQQVRPWLTSHSWTLSESSSKPQYKNHTFWNYSKRTMIRINEGICLRVSVLCIIKMNCR